MSPSTQTTATCRPRLVRTASQKKRSAAKAAETRARNKAAKAALAGQGLSAVKPEDPSTVNSPAPQIPQIQPGSTWPGNGMHANNVIQSLDPNLRTLQAPTTLQPVPSPPIEQGPSNSTLRTHLLTLSPHERLPGPSFNLETGQSYRITFGPSSLTGTFSLTVASSAGPSSSAGPLSTPSAPSRRVREKKPVLYRNYNPKAAIGLAGHEHKERWLLLRETVRGLLKVQRFQVALSWTRHTLEQRAAVVTNAHEELAKKAAADPEWARVICQPLLPQVIEDIAKDCCNNANSYKSQKQKNVG